MSSFADADADDAPDQETRRSRVRSTVVWSLRGLGLLLLVVIGVFVWGLFQPKPEGFSPTDPEGGAFSNGVWSRYTVDARSRTDWVFFDFHEGRVVEATFADADWDVAFKRTDLLTNSGITNPSGPGGAINLGEVEFGAASAPTSAGFAVDELGGEDNDEPMNPAISGWYSYSFMTHTVHAKENSYLVRTGESVDAVVHFDSYYCNNEDSGCITFRYRLVPAVLAS